MCCIEDSGICCCVSPEWMTPFFCVYIEEQSPAVRNYVLTLWTRFLLEQSDGDHSKQSRSMSSVNCIVCDDTVLSELDEAYVVTPPQNAMSDSAFSSDDGAMTRAPVQPRSKWNCLQIVGYLVFHKQPSLAIHTMQHLLRLVCCGGGALKRALFQHVFIPVFNRALPPESRSGAAVISAQVKTC